MRRWSDDWLMAAHRTMRLRMTRGAFPLSSFSGRKEACDEHLNFDVLVVIVLVLVFIALSAIRVVQQYERGVIFVLGRLIGAKNPGVPGAPPHLTHDES